MLPGTERDSEVEVKASTMERYVIPPLPCSPVSLAYLAGHHTRLDTAYEKTTTPESHAMA